MYQASFQIDTSPKCGVMGGWMERPEGDGKKIFPTPPVLTVLSSKFLLSYPVATIHLPLMHHYYFVLHSKILEVNWAFCFTDFFLYFCPGHPSARQRLITLGQWETVVWGKRTVFKCLQGWLELNDLC